VQEAIQKSKMVVSHQHLDPSKDKIGLSFTRLALWWLIHGPLPIPTAHPTRPFKNVSFGAPQVNFLHVLDIFLEIDSLRRDAGIVEGAVVNVRSLARY
jgi:hypothetical protein